MPTFIDITRPIHPGMAIYPENPPVVFTEESQASATTSALTMITFGSHTGTHIDAPSHMQADAKGTASYPLEEFIGPAEVIDLSRIDSVITTTNLPETSTERVLLKTRNSSNRTNIFDPGFVALDESAAEEIVKRGIKLVGIDALSIKKKGVKDRVHAILLDAGVVVLEGLWLADVAAGSYELICLPLAVDLDGAPVRAVLRSKQ